MVENVCQRKVIVERRPDESKCGHADGKEGGHARASRRLAQRLMFVDNRKNARHHGIGGQHQREKKDKTS